MDAKLLKAEAQNLNRAAMFIGITGAVFSVLKIIPSLLAPVSWHATIAAMILVLGYGMAFLTLDKMFKEAQEDVLKKFKLAVILGFCALVCANLPVIGGFAAAILVIVAAVFLLLGAKALKADEKLDEAAKKGAKLIFVAAILGIVAGALEIVGAIPLVGFIFNLLGRLMDVAVFILILVGVKKLIA